MNNKSSAQGQNNKPEGAAQPATHRDLDQGRVNFPTSQEIAERAYHIFLRQGAYHGNDLDHWLTAESELQAERQRTQPQVQPGRK